MLSQLYRNYLESNMTSSALLRMAEGLKHMGLYAVSQALHWYGEEGTGWMESSPSGIWESHPWYVGPHPPVPKQAGIVWFDTVELVPMILTPYQERDIETWGTWLTLHPIYVWQMRTFVEMVKWQSLPQWHDYLNPPADMFSRTRFENQSETDFVTNIYQQEAESYTDWFGKILPTSSEYLHGGVVLSEQEWALLIESVPYLWSMHLYDIDEFVRQVCHAETLGLEIPILVEEEYHALNGDPPTLSQFTYLSKWDLSADVSATTALNLQLGLIYPGPPRRVMVVESLNFAPRPPKPEE